MALRKFNPVTPGRRGLVLVDRSDLWSGKPVKKLTAGLSNKGGRNNAGRISTRPQSVSLSFVDGSSDISVGYGLEATTIEPYYN